MSIHTYLYCTYGEMFHRMHLSVRSRYLRDVKSGRPLNVSLESGLRMIGDQDVLRASRVPLYVENALLFTPFGDTFDARLGSAQLARSQAFSLALLARALRGGAAAGADSLDIYMHTRYHSGEQSTRGTRTKRASSYSPSLLLRPRERKEEERLEERSVLYHLRSSTQDLRRQEGSARTTILYHGLIVYPIDRSPTVSCAMTLPFANRKRKYGVKFPDWTSGSDLAVRS